MSPYFKNAISSIIIISLLVCSHSLKLYSEEEYSILQKKASFIMLSYNKYFEMFEKDILIERESSLKHSTQTRENKTNTSSSIEKGFLSKINDQYEHFTIIDEKTLDNFSLKIKYPECFNDPIKDQGLCQDSSSFSAAFALSKLFCIRKKSTYSNLSLSPQDLISCQYSNNKCLSSNLNESYDYMVTNGISEESCTPFESTVSLIEGKSYAPPCNNYCKKFEMPYIKYKARPYSIIDNDGIVFADIIKEDIYSSGPVSTYMDLYDDLLTYRGGIYIRTEESSLITTTHAVTLIGYGRDNNNAFYWIAANSFGSNWGEDGYFRIPFGHCNIGKLVISATANIPDLH